MQPRYTTRIVNTLKNGGIGVLPTDTLYGLVGSALIPQTVERMYALRQRELSKPFIVLISSVNDVALFKIKPSSYIKKALARLWPGPVSVIFPCRFQKFSYLHRGGKTIAFRLPADKTLRDLLRRVGPLVAPSANPAGKKSAHTVAQARKYFGSKIDFFIDGGRKKSLPSWLVSFWGRKMVVHRVGADRSIVDK